MKFYLLKQERKFNKVLKKFDYSNIHEEDFLNGVISRDFKLFDDINHKHYYCFLYTPEPQLRFLNKENFLNVFSIEKMEDYCEVTYEQMILFLKQYGDKYQLIIKKIDKLLNTY